MSRLLDSIKQAEWARRRRGKATPQIASDALTAAPSNETEIKPASTGDTTLGTTPAANAVMLRIEVDKSKSSGSRSRESGENSIDKEGPDTDRISANDGSTNTVNRQAQRHFSLDSFHDVQSESRARAERAATESARKKAENNLKRKAREESRIETERALAAAALVRLRAEREALDAAQARTRTEVEAARVARERARAEADAEAMARAAAQQQMQLKSAIDARVAAEREAESTALGKLEAEREAFEQAQARRKAEEELEVAAPARAKAEADAEAAAKQRAEADRLLKRQAEARLVAERQAAAAAKAARESEDKQAIEEEFGDMLLAMTSLARHLQVDPEAALRRANRKFLARFARLEASLDADQLDWSELSPDQLEQRWQAIKSAK